MRPPPLAQTSKPYPQTDIRRRRRTIHFGHNSPSHALTIPPQSNPHRTAHTGRLALYAWGYPFKTKPDEHCSTVRKQSPTLVAD
jgi:hypothetical protein